MRIVTLTTLLMLGTTSAAFAQTPPADNPAPANSGAPADALTRPNTVINGQDVKMPADTNIPVAPGVYTQSAGSGAIPSLPLQVMSVNGIQYVTGGVSDEELAELKSKDHDFNVQLLMTGTGGAYVSEAMVRVLDDKGGEVMPIVKGAGPYFYVNLKPGKYVVEVTAKQGGIKTANVDVPTVGSVKPILRFTE